MPLSTVTTGAAILASDLNQIIYVLERATGQTESGVYFLGFNAGAVNGLGSVWMPSLSRNQTPASSSFDTLIQSPIACGAVTIAAANSNGMQITASASGATINAHVAGGWTLNY